ncbi:MAG: hypothetical protein FK734_15865 [Asgard group archaeon]|nr:hypothetical protein [Asgard group archaeon]
MMYYGINEQVKQTALEYPVHLIIILSIASLGILILLFFIPRLFQRSRLRRERKEIEETIDYNISYNLLQKNIYRFIREKKFAHSIIYLFFIFRRYCKNELNINHALSIDGQELIRFTAGSSHHSMKQSKEMVDIYEKAKFTLDEITYDDFLKMKKLVEIITKKEI